jgi:lipopolysaccharide/colanic/teichoic acid biosynthesis glycosyltransferase
MKRLVDLLVSALGLLVLAPLFAAIGVAVKVSSRGPALYKATRAGVNGRTFPLLKFRTMYVGSPTCGAHITKANDPRVTPLGRWLRRHKCDEWPQLVNVLFGQMSLVGPRPEHPDYVALYTHEQRQVLTVRPGITGPASLRYRLEEELLVGPDWERTYIEEIMPAKLALELAYLRERSLRTDILMVLRTLRRL